MDRTLASAMPCCDGKSLSTRGAHAFDRHARFSNGSPPDSQVECNGLSGGAFRDRITVSGSSFASMPSKDVWQAPRSMSLFGQKVKATDKDRFLILNSKTWKTVLGPDRGLMANVDSGRKIITYVDGQSLAPFKADGTEVPTNSHIKQRRNAMEAVVEEAHMFEPDPKFEYFMDMSDSDEELRAANPPQPTPRSYYPYRHSHPRYPRAPTTGEQSNSLAQCDLAQQYPPSTFAAPKLKSPQMLSQQNLHIPQSRQTRPTTEKFGFPFYIPREIRRTANILNSCPDEDRNHGLPVRVWIKRQELSSVASRYGTFKHEDKKPNPILRFVGDERVLSLRMWAYMLFNGKAMPEGQGAYEEEYKQVYGRVPERKRGRRKRDRIEDVEIGRAGEDEGVEDTGPFERLMEDEAAHATETAPATAPLTRAVSVAQTNVVQADPAAISNKSPQPALHTSAQPHAGDTSSTAQPLDPVNYDDSAPGTNLPKSAANPQNTTTHEAVFIPDASHITDATRIDLRNHQADTTNQPQPTPSRSPSPPLTPFLHRAYHGPGSCTDALTIERCSALRQPCINTLQCGSIICETCEPLQRSHLSIEKPDVERGALMPLCQACQRDYLYSLFPHSGEVESECACLSFQCLSCLKHTACLIAAAREEYRTRFVMSWTKLDGDRVGDFKCSCGQKIEGDLDEVRLCAVCCGRVLKRDYVGADRGYWGKGKGVKYMAGSEGLLRPGIGVRIKGHTAGEGYIGWEKHYGVGRKRRRHRD